MTVRRLPHALLMAGSSQVTQFTDVTPARRLEKIIEHAASQPAPSFIGIATELDDVNFTTGNLDTVLAACQAEGCCADLNGGDTFMYYRKQLSKGKRVAVATEAHDSIQMESNAFLYWMTLDAEQRGMATLSGRVVPVSVDGATDPWTLNEDVAIPAGTAIASLFTLGPAKINGTFLDSHKRTSIDNQLTIDEDEFAGQCYLTYCGVDQWRPRITLETTDPRHFSTLDTVPLASLDLYFRKIQKNAKVYPDNQNQHIKISANGTGLITCEDISGRKPRVRITIDLDQPSEEVDPLSVLTGQQIT